MTKLLFLASLVALLFAGSTRAAELQTLTLQSRQLNARGLDAEVVEVNTRRSVGAVVAQDAIYGGLAGLAIGGGVALLNNGNDWARDLAIGAGSGLIVGGVFGAVDAATRSDQYAPPVGDSDHRSRGFGRAFKPISGTF
jgi:hypothetical protein